MPTVVAAEESHRHRLLHRPTLSLMATEQLQCPGHHSHSRLLEGEQCETPLKKKSDFLEAPLFSCTATRKPLILPKSLCQWCGREQE